MRRRRTHPARRPPTLRGADRQDRVWPLAGSARARCNPGMSLWIARRPLTSRHPSAPPIAGLSSKRRGPPAVQLARGQSSGPIARHRSALTATLAGTLVAALVLLGLAAA